MRGSKTLHLGSRVLHLANGLTELKLDRKGTWVEENWVLYPLHNAEVAHTLMAEQLKN